MRYDENTIIVRDKIYVPAESIDADAALDAYTHYMYQEAACRRCPNLPERHNFECDNCEAFRGVVATANRVVKNGIEYVGLPLGDRTRVEKKVGFDFDEFDIVDLRVSNKFDYKIKLYDLEPREHQKKPIAKFLEHKHGMIVAPPRSGKTPTMLMIAVKLGVRVMMIANQHEFLNQFIEHVEEYTNLPELQAKHKKKLYGFPDKIEDFDTLQIGVCTYQQFLARYGKKRFKAAARNFGALFIDEAHKANSNEFARVINSWPARYRLAVTGTDKRKDGRHILMREIVGKVICRVEIPQLRAKVSLHIVDYTKSRAKYTGKAGWTRCNQFLARHEKRNEEIVEWIIRDLKKGHNIVVPVYYKEHVWELVKRINDEWGSKIAEGFVGGGSKKNKDQREHTIALARKNKIRVIVGIRSILQLGLNVPAWSCLYYIAPMNNESNWKQESSRILTPEPDKREPLIRMFVDPNIKFSIGCWAATYKQTLKFKHAPTDKARERSAVLYSALTGSKGGEEDDYGFDVDREDSPKGWREKKPSRLKNPKAPKGLFSR